jgi:hypothetical protein
MSFDRQAARALFNNPESRIPDRTPRRPAPIKSEPPRPRTATDGNAVNPGIDEHGDLYARLSRPPKRSKASVVLPIMVGVGLLAGVGVIVMTQVAEPTSAENIAAPPVAASSTAPTAATPAPAAPIEAAAPAPVEPTATPAPPPQAVKAAPARTTATVRPSRPAARPTPKASAPAVSEPTVSAPPPVNPPVTATAPSEPATVILPPPLPAPAPEPTPPQ